MLKSLDPRITRLDIDQVPAGAFHKDKLDQFSTFEVFQQKREGGNYEHTGIVHAPDPEMAFLFAKEQFSRRFTCSGLWVVLTEDVQVTEYTDLEDNVYDRIGEDAPDNVSSEKQTLYEIFHLKKRGKQHVYAGPVRAGNYEEALIQARKQYDDGRPVLNVWVINANDILFSGEGDRDLWSTLAEKKYRDVTSYKVKDKLDQFKAGKASNPSAS